MGKNARRRKAAKLIEAWLRRMAHPPRPQRRYVDEAGMVLDRETRRRVRYRPLMPAEAVSVAPTRRSDGIRGTISRWLDRRAA